KTGRVTPSETRRPVSAGAVELGTLDQPSAAWRHVATGPDENPMGFAVSPSWRAITRADVGSHASWVEGSQGGPEPDVQERPSNVHIWEGPSRPHPAPTRTTSRRRTGSSATANGPCGGGGAGAATL